MPDRSTPHIAVHQLPVGAIKDHRVKVLDGDTQKVSWRQSTKGMLRDLDGDPVSVNRTKRNAKIKNTHSPHTGKAKSHKPAMGEKPESSSDE